jgi:hypothetical protein
MIVNLQIYSNNNKESYLESAVTRVRAFLAVGTVDGEQQRSAGVNSVIGHGDQVTSRSGQRAGDFVEVEVLSCHCDCLP